MPDAYITNLLMALIGVMLPVIGFCVVWILNGIKEEIRGVKNDVHILGKDLRADVIELHARTNQHATKIAGLEARCELLHEQSKDRA